MSGKSRMNGNPETPNSQHVDNAQRQQAMEFIQRMMMSGGGYTPVVKNLGTLGVKHYTMELGLPTETAGELTEPTECIVIPVDALMRAEWNHMNEVKDAQANILGGMQ